MNDGAKTSPGRLATASVRQRLKQAVTLQRAGRLLEAAALYSGILKTDAANADAWHLLGTVELERRNLEQAHHFITKALSLAPDRAIYHHNLAYLLGASGKLKEAEASYRKAVTLDRDYAEAYFNLSGSAKIAAGDPIIAEIERLVARDSMSQQDRCFLNFAAGKIYDDLGDYDRAFRHYAAGNTAKAVQFDPAENNRFVQQIIDVFDQRLFRNRAGQGSASERPVFVIGMPRSGTSLVEQILASHPIVHGAGELPDIEAIAKEFAKQAGGEVGFPRCMTTADQKAVRGLAEAYDKRLQGIAPEAQRVVNKTPINFRYLGLIAILFPRARILHCRRDPIDTCLSSYFQNFASGQNYAFDLSDLAAFYRDYRQLMAHWTAVLPIAVLDLDYEDLVADQDRVTREILAFCGLDWHEACAQFHRTERSVRTASRWQVRQPIYQTSVKRWRRYARHLAPLIEALGPIVEEGDKLLASDPAG